jgi:hypothetical protein
MIIAIKQKFESLFERRGGRFLHRVLDTVASCVEVNTKVSYYLSSGSLVSRFIF